MKTKPEQFDPEMGKRNLAIVKQFGTLHPSAEQLEELFTAKPKLKVYITEDGVNLYDLFKAGVGFGLANKGKRWTEQEWLAALEAALPQEFLATLTK